MTSANAMPARRANVLRRREAEAGVGVAMDMLERQRLRQISLYAEKGVET